MSLPPSGIFTISFFVLLSVFLCRSVFALLLSVVLVFFAYFPAPGFSFYYRSLPLRLLHNYPVFFQTLSGSLLPLSFSFLSLPLAQVYLSSLFPLIPFHCCGGCALRKFRVSGFSCLFCSTSTFPRYFFRCFYVLDSSSHLWGFPAWGSGVRIRLSVAPTLLLPPVIVLFGCLLPFPSGFLTWPLLRLSRSSCSLVLSCCSIVFLLCFGTMFAIFSSLSFQLFTISFFVLLSVFLCRSVFALLSSVVPVFFAYFPAPGFSFYYRSLPLRLLHNYPVFFQTLSGSLLPLSFSFLSLPLAQVYLSSLFPLIPFHCCGGCALRKFRVSGFSCLFCSTSTFPRYFFRCFYVLDSSSHLWGFPVWGSGVRIRLSVAPTLLLPPVIVLFGCLLSFPSGFLTWPLLRLSRSSCSLVLSCCSIVFLLCFGTMFAIFSFLSFQLFLGYVLRLLDFSWGLSPLFEFCFFS